MGFARWLCMKPAVFVAHCLVWFCALTPLGLLAQVQITGVSLGMDSVTLSWQGGQGPYLVQTSSDLLAWSDQGEPATGTHRTLSTFDGQRFYRLLDLDPSGLYGGLFGLLQTEQGEFGSLLARHRLKTRVWMHKSKGAPHTSTSYTPAAYWRKLFINYQSHEEGRVLTWTGALENLGTVATPGNDRRMTLTWTRGSGADLRTYVMTLDFPYPLNAGRTTTPFASDPTYGLKCTYATGQPELDLGTTTLKSTTVDDTNLVEMDPGNTNLTWSLRSYRVSKQGVQVNLHFLEGFPLYQGSPPWILKTLLLDRWLSPSTAQGGSLPAFGTDSYFSRTLLPGHHNFYEMVLIEPALDPALSETTRRILVQANIRQVFTVKDIAGVSAGGDSDYIRYFGYDNTVRDP
jgi:hypothetical protein